MHNQHEYPSAQPVDLDDVHLRGGDLICGCCAERLALADAAQAAARAAAAQAAARRR